MKIINETLEKDAIDLCVNCLAKQGSVLLLPTETVYGLFCRWDDEVAKNKILNMKKRDGNKPFQMIIPNINALKNTNINITKNIQILVDKFCPGPITIIANLNTNKDSQTNTIGFRIPAFSFLISLMNHAQCSLAATSANLSGNPPAQTVEDAINVLEGSPDLVVNADEISGDPSTVVDMTTNSFKILRHGPISEIEIMEALCLQD
jgi:L-threonylcarbamoyladenylate synthase